jgi:hypothetical protein
MHRAGLSMESHHGEIYADPISPETRNDASGRTWRSGLTGLAENRSSRWQK